MTGKLSRILDCKLKIDIDEDGTVYASINSPNFVLLGQGHSYDEAFTCLSEQLEIALSDLGEKKKHSGNFNLRVPPSLHAQIATIAELQGKSINELITQSIEANLLKLYKS